MTQKNRIKGTRTLRSGKLDRDHPQVLAPYKHRSPQNSLNLSNMMNILPSGDRVQRSVSHKDRRWTPRRWTPRINSRYRSLSKKHPHKWIHSSAKLWFTFNFTVIFHLLKWRLWLTHQTKKVHHKSFSICCVPEVNINKPWSWYELLHVIHIVKKGNPKFLNNEQMNHNTVV